jgi:hypothetical protein
MKTRISEITIGLTTLFLCLGLIVTATAEVINQDSEEVMIKSKAMVTEGSQMMMAAEKILREAKQSARDGQDPSKARQMMAKAEKMMSAGEKLWEQGLEMADGHELTKEKRMPITESDKNAIYRAKIMQTGMMIAEAMLTHNTKPLEKGLKMADRSEIHAGR